MSAVRGDRTTPPWTTRRRWTELRPRPRCCARSPRPAPRSARRWCASSRDALARSLADDRPRARRGHRHGRLGHRGRRRRGRSPGATCPVPVLAVPRATGCPAGSARWTSSIAVSCSGTTEETLSATDEALRRGARLVTVGAAGSPLAARAATVAARVHLPVDAHGRMPRANLWGLAVPVLLVARRGRAWPTYPAGLLVRTRRPAGRGRPSAAGRCVDSLENPAKTLALELAGSLPYVWGASDVATSRRPGRPRSSPRTRSTPRCTAPLTEVHHNQVVVMAGVFGAARRRGRRGRHLPRPGRRRARPGRGCGCCCCATPTSVPRGRGPRRRVAPGRRAVRRAVQRAARRGRAPADPAGQPGRAAGLRHASTWPCCRASTPRPIEPIVALKGAPSTGGVDRERVRRQQGDRRGARPPTSASR